MKTLAQIALAILVFAIMQELNLLRHDYEKVHNLSTIIVLEKSQ